MSFIISWLRSPKPGAFTAATWIVPRSLLTTRVANASPSTSSEMINNGLPSFEGGLLEQRQHVLEAVDLLFVDEDVGVLEDAVHSIDSGLVTK